MNNRADRRKKRKELPRYERIMTPEQQLNALIKNGITPKNLKDEYHRGYEKGYEDAKEFVGFSMCAALGLAMNDLYGFGKKRVTRTINLAAQYMFNAFTEREIMEEVYNRIGFEFADDPISGNLVEEID